MDENKLVCANRQCRIAEDKKCVEGLEFEKCPYYGRDPSSEAQDNQNREAAPDAVFDGVRLQDGRALEAAHATAQLRLSPSKVIAIVGAYDSGKSSVIAGLYDLLQMGPISNIQFAGSSTLQGFELICHDARVASDRQEAHSERTKRGEVSFFHIDVLRDERLLSLLIADRSGEEYEEVADLTANATAMFELRRADVLTILVDGRRLSSPTDRAQAIAAISMIIQGMVENRAFERTPDVAVVLTKNDVVVASAKPDRAQKDFEAIVDGLRTRFASSFGDILSFVTSASPKDTKTERGFGLDKLFEFWTAQRVSPQVALKRHQSGRVFDTLISEESSDE